MMIILTGILYFSWLLSSAKGATLESLANDIADLKRKVAELSEPKHVHFFATLSGARTLKKNTLVVFDKEVDDYGNNFNPKYGVFIAPVTGYYQFAWTMFTQSRKTMNTELRVGDVKIDSMHGYSSSGISAETRMVICKVNEGEKVYIKTSHHYDTHYLHSPWGAGGSFIGILLNKA